MDTTIWTPGQRVIVTETPYGTWDGEAGTVVEATPALVAMMAKPGAPDLSGTVWVYMDAQAASHAADVAAGRAYAQPEPVGFDAHELVAEPAALAPGGSLRP